MFVAHVRNSDGCPQSVEKHLLGVGEKARVIGKKMGLANSTELQGLLHDFGKYSIQFRDYINSATGRIGSGSVDQDIDGDYVDAKSQKGKIDHSSAGAQWIYQTFKETVGTHSFELRKELFAQMLALCIASHHSGLIDCIDADGNNQFRTSPWPLNDSLSFQQAACFSNQYSNYEKCQRR